MSSRHRHAVVILLALIVLSLSPAAQAPRPPVHRLVEVRVHTDAEMDRARALALDVVAERPLAGGVVTLEVVATGADVARVAAAGLRHTVRVADLEAHYAARLAAGGAEGPVPAFGFGSMGGYHTWAETVKLMDDLHKLNPKIVSAKWSLGKSVETRDIWAVKISDNVGVDENEPEVHFDSLTHAREPMSMECTFAFMYWLVENYGKDALATYLVNERELFFVPVVNPDGYEYNRRTYPNGGGMWRKNRRDNGGGVYGVDLNRNFPFQWGGVGASTTPSSTTYRGPSAASEPEIKALLTFLSGRKFVVGMNSHSYSDLFLRPFGYTSADPANAAQYDMIGRQAVKVNKFPYGGCAKLLYPASGGGFDTFHGTYNMYGFLCEIGSSADGFWPPKSRIVPLIDANLWMFQAVALSAGPAVEGELVAIREVGPNPNGSLDPGDTVGLEVQVENFGAAASAGPVAISLGRLTPGCTPIRGNHSFGTLASFTTTTNGTALLTFKLPATAAGPISGEITLLGSYRPKTIPFRFLVGLRRLAHDDAEVDLGWTLGVTGDTASTGVWNRMAPQQTVYGGQTLQPGSDTTPAPGTRCWVTDGVAGASAGSNDVDGGFTTLLSPVLDLAHLQHMSFRYQRWFVDNQAQDIFRVGVSVTRGVQWSTLEDVESGVSKWVAAEPAVPAALTPTNGVQLRFVAEDANTASLVEAAVDDLEIWGVTPSPSLIVLGSGRVGTVIRICRSVPETGVTGLLLVAPSTGSSSFPGMQGILLLDPNRILIVSQDTYKTGAYRHLDLTIPAAPVLAGGRIWFQEAVFDLSGPVVTGAFSNRQGVLFR